MDSGTWQLIREIRPSVRGMVRTWAEYHLPPTPWGRAQPAATISKIYLLIEYLASVRAALIIVEREKNVLRRRILSENLSVCNESIDYYWNVFTRGDYQQAFLHNPTELIEKTSKAIKLFLFQQITVLNEKKHLDLICQSEVISKIKGTRGAFCAWQLLLGYPNEVEQLIMLVFESAGYHLEEAANIDELVMVCQWLQEIGLRPLKAYEKPSAFEKEMHECVSRFITPLLQTLQSKLELKSKRFFDDLLKTVVDELSSTHSFVKLNINEILAKRVFPVPEVLKREIPKINHYLITIRPYMGEDKVEEMILRFAAVLTETWNTHRLQTVQHIKNLERLNKKSLNSTDTGWIWRVEVETVLAMTEGLWTEKHAGRQKIVQFMDTLSEP